MKSLFLNVVCVRILAILFMVVFAGVGVSYAKDWYVRPAGGDYGSETGSSYKNAWDGLKTVKWGDGGVGPGDTLWVCGVHLHDLRTRASIVSQADITPVSGSVDKVITIRGDCPKSPGVIWGAARMLYDEWRNEGGDVWSIWLPANQYPDWYFQDIGMHGPDDYLLLDRAYSLDELRAKPGSHYSDSYKGSGGNVRLYVHLKGGGTPGGRVSFNRWGYEFKLAGVRHLVFKDIAFMNFNRIDPKTPVSHVKWKGCKFFYGEHSLLSFYDGSHDIEVAGCEFAWAGNGIYNISGSNDAPRDYVYRNNHFHDIGVRKVSRNSDAHSIGIQGGSGGVIEGNRVENCGTGPLLYAFTDQNLTNTLVKGNFVRDLHLLGGANGYGVSTMCNNDSMSDKSGNIFCCNVVVNAAVAYRFQFEDEQIVCNNVAYKCGIGLQTTRCYNNTGSNVRMFNNIFVDNGMHFDWRSKERAYKLFSDMNVYHPAQKYNFKYMRYRLPLSQWRRLKRKDCVFDPNSMSMPVEFENFSGNFSRIRDFMPRGRPGQLIDAGLPVPFKTDALGNPLVGRPDIGAVEMGAKNQ